jgi:hypothetical protein
MHPRRPSFAHRVTVLGSTRNINATSPGANSGAASAMLMFRLSFAAGRVRPSCGGAGSTATAGKDGAVAVDALWVVTDD